MAFQSQLGSQVILNCNKNKFFGKKNIVTSLNMVVVVVVV
jgi:hypothetical protein